MHLQWKFLDMNWIYCHLEEPRLEGGKIDERSNICLQGQPYYTRASSKRKHMLPSIFHALTMNCTSHRYPPTQATALYILRTTLTKNFMTTSLTFIYRQVETLSTVRHW